MSVAAGAVGLDLIEISRLERALERRPGLAGRLFTSGELELARSRRRPARHLAARFAAKEAAKKALAASGAESAIAPREVEVVGSAPPALRLHGAAAEAAGTAGLGLTVSLTHSRELAAAVVLAGPASRH